MSHLIERSALTCVLVVGDVMLDEYLLGNVGRLSPEAPVPVVSLGQERWVPGGAANVAANVAALGGRGLLAGVVGRDTWGERLAWMLAGEARLDTMLVRCDGRPTTVKTRILAGAQHIVRIDREATHQIQADVESSIRAWAEARLDANVSACVLSDYGKGGLPPSLLQALITKARDRNIPVVVDPKGRDFSRYRGATVVTPNEAEASQADCARGTSSLEGRAARLQAELGGSAVLVTRGAQGVSLFRESHASLHLPARNPDKAVDTTGAGDTLVATLALMLGAGVELSTAIHVANEAAGLVVRKPGTSVLQAEELHAQLANDDSALHLDRRRERGGGVRAPSAGHQGERAP